jgi:hypothetical protein
VGKRVQIAGLLLVLCAAVSGCVTPALWKEQAFDGLNQPARPPNLQVYKMQDDWLIEYDEANEKNERIRRRAYYLNENQAAIEAHKPPRFVRRPETASFEVAQALISTNTHQFTLYDGGENRGTYEFPIYPAPSGRVKQVLLTPGAVVADAAIVGAVIVVIAGAEWLKAGGPAACLD